MKWSSISEWEQEEAKTIGASFKARVTASGHTAQENAGDNGKVHGIYRCFEKNNLLSSKNSSSGVFALTDTHLNFFVVPDGEITDLPQSQYAFASLQLKDITGICANYEKRINWKMFFAGLFMILLPIVLLILFKTMLPFLKFLCYAFVFLGFISTILSFTALRIRVYKINIGSLNGGVTIMGAYGKSMSSGMIWNQPMTIVYNAKPLEGELIAFVETINQSISKLQERGEYAFDNVEVIL